MCEQVSYIKKRLLWPCVNQGHECETELCVCVWTASVKTTSCVWASQTGHVHIWWTHIHKHIHILAGVPTQLLLILHDRICILNKNTHIHTGPNLRTIKDTLKLNRWLDTHTHAETHRSRNQLIPQTGNKPLWSTEINDLIEEYNRRRKRFIPLFWTSKDPACFNKPNFMNIQMNQESY